MLQSRRPYESPTLHVCILCKGNGELIARIFYTAHLLLGLWHKLFIVAKMDSIPPKGIEDMVIISFKGFWGIQLEASLFGKLLTALKNG